MAEPVGFEGAASLLIAAPGDEGTVRDLAVFTDGTQTISCWRLSKEELAQIAETGVVWLSVSGRILPPAYVSGTALVLIDGRPSRAEPVVPSPRTTK